MGPIVLAQTEDPFSIKCGPGHHNKEGTFNENINKHECIKTLFKVNQQELRKKVTSTRLGASPLKKRNLSFM